jgi:hypothetical protein
MVYHYVVNSDMPQQYSQDILFCFCCNNGYMNTQQHYVICTLPLLFHQKKNTTWQTKFRNLVVLNQLYCLVKQELYRWNAAFGSMSWISHTSVAIHEIRKVFKGDI